MPTANATTTPSVGPPATTTTPAAAIASKNKDAERRLLEEKRLLAREREAFAAERSAAEAELLAERSRLENERARLAESTEDADDSSDDLDSEPASLLANVEPETSDAGPRRKSRWKFWRRGNRASAKAAPEEAVSAPAPVETADDTTAESVTAENLDDSEALSSSTKKNKRRWWWRRGTAAAPASSSGDSAPADIAGLQDDWDDLEAERRRQDDAIEAERRRLEADRSAFEAEKRLRATADAESQRLQEQFRQQRPDEPRPEPVSTRTAIDNGSSPTVAEVEANVRRSLEAEMLETSLQRERESLAAERQRLEELRVRLDDALLVIAERDSAAASVAPARPATDAAAKVSAAEAHKALVAELRAQLALIVDVADTDRGLLVRLDDLSFPTGTFELQPPAREKLARLAGVISVFPGVSISVEGHTDDVGDETNNLLLSERRAAAVSTYLMSQGVPGTALQFRGLGETQPTASNSTSAGRQINRRVELVVVDPS